MGDIKILPNISDTPSNTWALIFNEKEDFWIEFSAATIASGYYLYLGIRLLSSNINFEKLCHEDVCLTVSKNITGGSAIAGSYYGTITNKRFSIKAKKVGGNTSWYDNKILSGTTAYIPDNTAIDQIDYIKNRSEVVIVDDKKYRKIVIPEDEDSVRISEIIDFGINLSENTWIGVFYFEDVNKHGIAYRNGGPNIEKRSNGNYNVLGEYRFYIEDAISDTMWLRNMITPSKTANSGTYNVNSTTIMDELVLTTEDLIASDGTVLAKKTIDISEILPKTQ